MNFLVDIAKATKKWAPVLDSLNVTDPEKRQWMAEYAEFHALNENVGYSTLGNVDGMGAVVAPVVGGLPGGTWTSDGSTFGAFGGGTQGSGDVAQNLLPVSMKIAAQTIGLDLVAVKPSSSPRIEMLFVDFKYDNNAETGFGDKDERPLIFKLNVYPTGSSSLVSSDNTLRSYLKYAMAAQNAFSADGLPVYEYVGGLSKRMFFKLTGSSSADFATYFGVGATEAQVETTVGNHLVEPSATQVNTTDATTGGRQGWLEFLGFSRIDGWPMFRIYRQINTAANQAGTSTTTNGAWGFIPNRNTFPNSVTTISTGLVGATILSLYSSAATLVNYQLSGVTIELVSTMEDHIPGFSAGWQTPNMTRLQDEQTYPGVIGPDVFTKSIQVGDIEISSALKRTQIEDIKASTGMDIVQKLESVLINELSQTISKQIVEKIKALAEQNRTSPTAPVDGTGNPKFDLNVDVYVGGGGFGPAPGGETTHSIQRKLIAKINNSSNFLATDGRVGPAQYLVTNGNMASVIQDVAGYTLNPVNAGKLNTNGQLYPMGNIGNIAIYVDPYMRWDDNRIFVGRKNSVDQPGLVFIPYLMAQSISLISEATWAPRMLIRSRYAVADIGFFPWKQFMAIHVTDSSGILI